MSKSIEKAEVTVIGGGIMGLSTAYHLAKSGSNVILVEMGKIAAGASGCNNGEFSRGYGESGELGIYAGSYKMYEDWNESGELGYDIEFEVDSEIWLLTDKHIESMKRSLWKRRLEIWEKAGRHPLKRNEWEIPEPNITEDIKWGIETTVNTINRWKVCYGLARTAEKYGAKIFTHTKVIDIELKKDKVQNIVTTKGKIKTEYVVDASGPWSHLIGRMVGIYIPILPAIGTHLHTEQTPPLTYHKHVIYRPLWYNSDQPFISNSEDPYERLGISTGLFYYKRPEVYNYMIERSEHIVPLPPRGAKINVEPETIKYIAEGAIRIVPKLKNLNIIRAHAGMRPICPVDGKPILGNVEGIEGYVLATGLWHTGMSWGPMCGKLISELVSGKKPSISIEEFNFSRFVKSHHFPYVHLFREV
jgi:sarcosine oxidase subunit beta